MASPKERLGQLDTKDLPMAAARYCRSENVERSAAAFRKLCTMLGATKFRQALEVFISEGEAGDLANAHDWGAVFYSRLEKLADDDPGF